MSGRLEELTGPGHRLLGRVPDLPLRKPLDAEAGRPKASIPILVSLHIKGAVVETVAVDFTDAELRAPEEIDAPDELVVAEPHLTLGNRKALSLELAKEHGLQPALGPHAARPPIEELPERRRAGTAALAKLFEDCDEVPLIGEPHGEGVAHSPFQTLRLDDGCHVEQSATGTCDSDSIADNYVVFGKVTALPQAAQRR